MPGYPLPQCKLHIGNTDPTQFYLLNIEKHSHDEIPDTKLSLTKYGNFVPTSVYAESILVTAINVKKQQTQNTFLKTHFYYLKYNWLQKRAKNPGIMHRKKKIQALCYQMPKNA